MLARVRKIASGTFGEKIKRGNPVAPNVRLHRARRWHPQNLSTCVIRVNLWLIYFRAAFPNRCGGYRCRTQAVSLRTGVLFINIDLPILPNVDCKRFSSTIAEREKE